MEETVEMAVVQMLDDLDRNSGVEGAPIGDQPIDGHRALESGKTAEPGVSGIDRGGGEIRASHPFSLSHQRRDEKALPAPLIEHGPAIPEMAPAMRRDAVAGLKGERKSGV